MRSRRRDRWRMRSRRFCLLVEEEITKEQEEKDVINEFKVVKSKDQDDKKYEEAENGRYRNISTCVTSLS